MILLLIIVFILLYFGFYLSFAGVLRLMPAKVSKNFTKSKSKQKDNSLESFSLEFAHKLSRFIYINDYKKKILKKKLKILEINMTPETFIAKKLIKSFIVGILGILIYSLSPILSVLCIFLAVILYLSEFQKMNEEIKKKKDAVEFELPRFCNTISEELKIHHDILKIFEKYKETAGEVLKKELEMTISDMKSSNYESALIRFEGRISSSNLSELTRGLLSTLRGDDNSIYFQILSHDLKQIELQRLKMVAIKQPEKIKKYSILLFLSAILIYGVVLGVYIFNESAIFF